MDRQNKKPDWLFYLAWVIFSALAIPLALGGTFLILAAITNQTGGYITVNGQRHIAEDYLALPFDEFFAGPFAAPLFPKNHRWVGWRYRIGLAGCCG